MPDREVEAIVKKMNKSLGGKGAIMFGRDIDDTDKYRLPSGSLTVDIVSGGGIPTSGMTELFGPESSCKTALSFSAAAYTQALGGRILFAAGEGFGKQWARRNGVYVPFAEAEVDNLEELSNALAAVDSLEKCLKYHQYRESLTLDDDYDFDEQLEIIQDLKEEEDVQSIQDYLAGFKDFLRGDILVAYHKYGDGLLGAVHELMWTGKFDLVIVDSISVLKPEAILEKKGVGDKEVGSHAQMVNQFVDRNYAIWNMNQDLRMGLIVINQAAERWGNPVKMLGNIKERSGAFGMKHGKILSLFARRSETFEDPNKEAYAIGSTIARTKQKVSAAALRKGPIKFFTADGSFEGRNVYAGLLDHSYEVMFWSIYSGLIKKKGAWLEVLIEGEFEGMKFNGDKKCQAALDDNNELRDALEEEVYIWAEKMKQSIYKN